MFRRLSARQLLLHLTILAVGIAVLAAASSSSDSAVRVVALNSEPDRWPVQIDDDNDGAIGWMSRQQRNDAFDGAPFYGRRYQSERYKRMDDIVTTYKQLEDYQKKARPGQPLRFGKRYSPYLLRYIQQKL